MLVSALKEQSDDGRRAFSVDVRYRYVWEGRAYESTNFSSPNQVYAHRDEVWGQLADFPVGATVTCRVDSGHPQRAVLSPDSLDIGLYAILPLLISAFAACGLVATWTDEESRAGSFAGMAMGVCFCAAFFVAGVMFFNGLFLRGWAKGRATEKWVATPCTLVFSGLERTGRSDSRGAETSLRATADYAYRFNGRDYVGDRITAVNGFVNNHEEEQLSSSLVAGRRMECYVNPERPFESALRRGAGNLIAALLVALGFGLGGLAGMLRFYLAWRRGLNTRGGGTSA